MNIRRNHRQGQAASSSKARLTRVRDKAARLRERIKQATLAFQQRRERHLAWWQMAFKVPLVGFFGWAKSRCATLWGALMLIIGLPRSAKRASRPQKSPHRSPATHRQVFRRMLTAEGLEARQLMAADIYVDDVSHFSVTTDNNSNSNPDTGDVVTWLGPDGNLSTTNDNIDGLTFGQISLGKGAFTDLQAAINAASSGDTIHLGVGDYSSSANGFSIPADKDGLKIFGAKAGIGATDNSRNLESGTGESTVHGYIRIESNGVEINGLRVLDGANILGENAGIYVAAHGATISNSILYRTGDSSNFSGITTSLPAGTSDGLTVKNSVMQNWHTGVYVQAANNVTVQDNLFQSNTVGMSADAYSGGNAGLSVTGNQFVDNDLEGLGIGQVSDIWAEGSTISNNHFTGPAIFSYSPGLPLSVIGANTPTVSTTYLISSTSAPDTIGVTGGPNDTVEIRVNNALVSTVPLASQIQISGGDGDDALTLDMTNLSGIDLVFKGQSGSDDLKIIGDRDGTFAYKFDNKATNSDDDFAGDITFTDGSTSVESKIRFTGLEPVVNSVAAGDVVVDLPDGGNSVTLSATANPNEFKLSGGSTFEETTFTLASGASLTINGGSGTDSLTINALTLPGNFTANMGTNDTVTLAGDLSTSNSGAISITGAQSIAANPGADINSQGAVRHCKTINYRTRTCQLGRIV